MADNQIDHKSLSIRVCSNGLSFCTYAPGQDSPFEWKAVDMNHTISLAANLKTCLKSEPAFREEYQRVNVLVTTPLYTTLPVVAFEKEDIHAVFKLMFPKDTESHVSYNVLRRAGVAIVFGIDRNVRKLLVDDFPRARFYASASTLIEFLGERSMLGAARKMYVYVHDREMTLYAFKQGRLLFTNSYAASHVGDLQFHTLNMWKELEFDQTEDELYVVGDDEGRVREMVEKIRYFVRHAAVMDPAEDFKDRITRGDTRIPYDLQTLLVCGF